MFNTLDAFLLNKFQKFSDWSQEWIGWNNFFWARIVFVLVTLEWTGSEVLNFFIDKGPSIPFDIFFALLTVAVALFLKGVIDIIEQKCMNNDTYANDIAIRGASYREWVILFTFIFLGDIPRGIGIIRISADITTFAHGLKAILSGTDQVFMLIMLYFLGCTPKPPKRSKARKLIEKVKEKLSPQPQLATV